MRILSREISGGLGPSLAPLICVVVLIAVLAPMLDRPVPRPAQSALPPSDADFDPIIIRVSPGPRWQVNGTPMQSPDELRQRLTPVVGIKRDVPIVIVAVGEVPPGDVTALGDVLRQMGFERIQAGESAK